MKLLQLLTTTAFTVALASSSAIAAEIIATQTNETIGNGLKVYSVRLVDNSGNTVDTVRAVSGRASQQTPSDRAGSQTPLPFGVYRFDNPGSVINLGGEFGGVWSAITPTFSTARSGLGLHYDPSTFKNNGQAGTAGCLATPTVAERDIVSNFIRTYRPTRLTVNNEPLVPNGEQFAVNNERLTVNNEHTAVSSEQLTVNNEPAEVSTEQLTVSSEHTAVSSERLTVSSEQFAVNNEQLTVNNEPTAVSNEQLTMNNERGTALGQPSTTN